MSLFQEQLEELQKLTKGAGVTRDMVVDAGVSDGLLPVAKPKHWTEKAREEDGNLKFFGKMLLGGFTGLTPLLFPEAIGSKARYESELDIYEDEVKHAREQAMRQQYVDVLMDPNASHRDRMAAASMAGGVGEFDPNPITASPGAAILGAGTGEVIHNQPGKAVAPPAAVAEAQATARAKGIPLDHPIMGDLIAAYAEPTETRTEEDGATYSVNTVNEVLGRWEQEQMQAQQAQPEATVAQAAVTAGGQDPNTLGPVLDGINKEQAELVTNAPEKLKFYRNFGEIMSELGEWDEATEQFIINEDVTDLYGSWDGNRLNPQNWGSGNADNGGFGGETEYFMPQGNRNSKAAIEQMIEALTVDERGKLKGQGQITEGETAMLRAAVTRAAKRGMDDKAAQREFTRLYKEFIRSKKKEEDLLKRYWPDNPILSPSPKTGGPVGDVDIDLDA